ncbi:hypothetical protein BSR29_06645 [Boudabousia liubingyangii]|uniref:Uncharacterized protein n=1 Tax=Boudabousia liubingyangii TaxID=1921764 RepID=A0A1Q5PKX2_9ACTO|nr:glycosyltransferase [Boudabousia liubingyangii]OKL47289.1 hypothetical protein BSR29_06645 [Boudabousia liubingyangii]
MASKVVQRVVFSAENDSDTQPLYFEGALKGGRKPSLDKPGIVSYDRSSAKFKNAGYTSFGTYFNAFPASYWRRHTVVREVTLRVKTAGQGTLILYRSNAKGDYYRLESHELSGSVTKDFKLPLNNFLDGGWYWFDLKANSNDFELLEGQWLVDEKPRLEDPKLTIAITTFNRPTDCALMLKQLSSYEPLREVLREIVVVDQGNKKVAEEDNYQVAKALLKDQLRVIDQINLGGSGGFSRGMYESLQNNSDFVLLLDDDVRVEPEGMLRALAFGSYTNVPTIVGGHMFSMYQRTFLHAFAETVRAKEFLWGPTPGVPDAIDFNKVPLRVNRKLHALAPANYNGWWMCLIPTLVVEEIGLSLPFFIKWDDSEYCLRAGKHGVPTVTLPGAAVWHVPWTDKDDSVDWQAYFHYRNRLVAGLMHSKFSRGGGMIKHLSLVSLKHFLSQQYSVLALQIKALEDILRGPEHMHDEIETVVPEVRKIRGNYKDAQLVADPTLLPAPRSSSKLPKWETLKTPKSLPGRALMAAKGILRIANQPTELSREYPEMYVSSGNSNWLVLSQLDSAVVTNSDGSGVSFYQRDPRLARKLYGRLNRLVAELVKRWPELSRQYQEALDGVTSPAAWEPHFHN